MAERIWRERLRGMTIDGVAIEVEIRVSVPVAKADDARLCSMVDGVTSAVETAAALEGFCVPLGRLDGLDVVRRT